MSCSGSAERHEFLRARVDSSLLNARTSRFETSHIRSVIFTPSILPALNMRRTYPPLQPASSAACVIVIMLRSSLAMSATLATQRIQNVRTHTCTSSVRCKLSASPPNRSGGHGTTEKRTTDSRTEFMRTCKQTQAADNFNPEKVACVALLSFADCLHFFTRLLVRMFWSYAPIRLHCVSPPGFGFFSVVPFFVSSKVSRRGCKCADVAGNY